MARKPRNPSMEISWIMVTAMIMLSSCSSNLLVCGEILWKPTWTKEAAKEAEVVAGIGCSGHGRAYLDGLVLKGHHHLPLCDCNPCFYGPTCSKIQLNCSANAESGDPLFLEPFWMRRAKESAILISGWHRMGYTYSDGTYISEVLVKYIQRLHKMVGNAETDGRFIVFGAGSTQLLNAAVFAFSPNSSSSSHYSPAKVVATAPYYPVYRQQTELFNSLDYRYEGDTSLWKNKTLSENNNISRFIEFVTSPNSPDGGLMKAALHGSNVKTIYDHAYYWPHFTPIPASSDHELMIFTMSKLTGHAGSRFGWALVKDKAVYQKMLTYLDLNTVGVSRESQLRALKLLDVLLEEGDGTEIFKFGYSTMRKRWIVLRKILSNSKRFSLQKLTPHYCSFFKRVRNPTPAYAWLKCEREEDKDCHAVLKAAKINGHPGSMYSADDRYVRLNLIGSQDYFGVLIHHLRYLLAQSY
ncbi:tryptophan aminotransferase-related protein 4-like [Neltuma alba]|uniref:tryptophan aminotransferase-related protein 4-like n=1 Tax=Neltuma alba TaxID=207710 RepID=UPI0010A4C08E|nr:tryptophan aminotransferase-related protein 4-like [Prosopis alba]